MARAALSNERLIVTRLAMKTAPEASVRERIVEAALDLFSRHGYAGASMRQIAAAVGIRASSLYNHFDSKAAIYRALIEAIRSNSDHGSDPGTVDSTSWTRALADWFEREADHCEQRRKKETLPSRGDRIELAQGLGFSVRGTVQYVDQVQALVKLDDGRSRSLRIGIDGFRIVSPDETA